MTQDKSIVKSFIYLEMILLSVIVIFFAFSIFFSFNIKQYYYIFKNQHIYMLEHNEKINEDIEKIKSVIYTSALRRGFDNIENKKIVTYSKIIKKDIEELEEYLFKQNDKELEFIILNLKKSFDKFYIIGKDLSNDFRKSYDEGMDGLGAIDILEKNMSKNINLFNNIIKERIIKENDYIYNTSQSSIVVFLIIGLLATVLSVNVYFRLSKLRQLNIILHKKVAKKNKKLKRFNSYLKYKIKTEVDISRQKDKIIFKELKYSYISEMLSMIAHQWRQPLSIISSASGHLYIQNQFGTIESNEAEKHLTTINNATQKLSNIIEEFKTFFQPNTKKDNSDILKIINESIDFMSISIEDSNVKLINNTKELEIKELYVYKNNLIQVFTNIIKNSIEALENIDNKELIIENKIENEFYIIEFSDNANGISFDIVDKIFEPYFSTKSKNERGLGLYMSKIIINDYHQGNIYFENLKEGVKFIIKLPLSHNTKENCKID